jgi:hypothetical protein
MSNAYARSAIAALIITAMIPNSAGAVLLTAPDGVPVNAPTVDFSQFAATGRIAFPPTGPPFTIDDLPNETVLMRPISANGTGAVIILGDHTPPLRPDNNFYLDMNGRWTPGRAGFLAMDNGPSTNAALRIEFPDAPVALVGGLFNQSVLYPPLIISALDSNHAVLEQYAINVVAPISTPGQIDVGAFRGIIRTQNDIFALKIEGSFVVVDDIRFFRIPEPGAITLIGLAITILVARRRK